ncbi:MAG: hypothetical protein WC943_11690 [Elusimicrobiota bacterium]|jgi:hypothetical protein
MIALNQVSKQVAQMLAKDVFRFKPDAQVTVFEGALSPMLGGSERLPSIL